MKKITLPPTQSPFRGDCTRQSQLNRSVDDVIRRQVSGGRLQQNKPVPQSINTAGEIICGVLFFVTLIGCAYLGMAC